MRKPKASKAGVLSEKLARDMSIPLEISRAFNQAPEVSMEQELLLREVCARAVMDALGQTGEWEVAKHNKAVRSARTWLLEETEYSHWRDAVFDLASVQLPQIQRSLAEMTAPLKIVKQQ